MTPKKIIRDWSQIPVIFNTDFAVCLLGMKRDEITRMARLKYLPAFRIHNRWFFERDALKEWIFNQMQNGKVTEQ